MCSRATAIAVVLLLLPAMAAAGPGPSARRATPASGPTAAPGAKAASSARIAPPKVSGDGSGAEAVDSRPADGSTAAPHPGAKTLSRPLLDLYEEALNAFKYQDFDTAIPLLHKLLAKGGQLDRKRRWRVREFLGAALWFTSDKQGAADQFTGLLIQNPQARLDPAYYPPRMIADFVKARRKMIALGMIKPDDKPPPAGTPGRSPDPNPLLLWMPFGVGQLTNDQTGKGLAFLVAESALLSANLYYRYYVNEYRAGRERRPLAPLDQAVQISTGIAFYLVTGWGIADALLTRRQTTLPRAGTLPAR